MLKRALWTIRANVRAKHNIVGLRRSVAAAVVAAAAAGTCDFGCWLGREHNGKRGRLGGGIGYVHQAEAFALKPCWNRQTQWIASECDFDG